MFNAQLTKLRLLYERARREQLAAEDLAYEKRRACENLWMEYGDEANRCGLCRLCFEPLTESNTFPGSGVCKNHTLMASSGDKDEVMAIEGIAQGFLGI